MKKAACVIVFLLVLVILSGGIGYVEWIPHDGPWYCEELQIQFTFTYGKSYAVINGQRVRCNCFNDTGSKYLTIETFEDMDSVPVGTVVLEAMGIDLTDTELVVQDLQSGEYYTFTKGARWTD